MFVTVETQGGSTAVVAVANITHLTSAGTGSQINFVSGEHITVTKGIGDLTLALSRTAS